MKIAVKARPLIWVLLWASFFAFGIAMRHFVQEQGVYEVFGYDYDTFMKQMRNLGWITYTGVRHPGLGLLMSPVVIVAALLERVSSYCCDLFLISVMSVVVTLCVCLVWKIAGVIASFVFITFGFTWVLASVPESFPIAMLSLLVVIAYVNRREQIPVNRNIVWGLLFVLCSMVTITNGLKVALAYLIAEKLSRKELIRAAWLLGVIIFLVATFFAIRMMMWNFSHPEHPKTIIGGIAQTLRWVPQGMGVFDRVKTFAMGFVTIPLVPRIEWKALSWPEMPSFLGIIWVSFLGIISLVSVYVNRRLTVTKVMVGMFAVDFTIHVVCGWGLNEGWIFCAHWFWMVAILTGMFARKFCG